MTVVYVDSVFFLNAGMDYLLLLATARLAGVPLRRGRYLLGALAGGAYAVAVFLPGCGILANTPIKLAFGVLLALVAFGGEEKLLRLTLLLFAVSCALAGCVLGLGLLAGSKIPVVNGIFYTDINAKILLLAACAAYLILTVVFRAAAKQGVGGELLPVTVCLNGKTVELTALHDTGNALQDPASGQMVLVTARGALHPILPQTARALLSDAMLRFPPDLLESLRGAAPELHTRLIPYHTVGMPGGLLLAVRTDWTEIAGERYPGLLAALSPTSFQTGYCALWGGEQGGYHESVLGKAAAAAHAHGTVAGGGRPLHWRKRHAAASADAGEGSGAVAAHRRGACEAGDHRT